MAKPLISLKNLTKNFVNGDVVTKVLHGLTFEVEENEFVAIMGRSGSGKSTLMNILGFLERPSGGDYFFKGENIKNLSDDDSAVLRNKEIGFIFQSFNLLPKTSVYENVKLPLIYSHIPESEYAKKIEDVIKAVGLWDRKDYLSNQLSGGEKQRVAIARALVNGPAIIFADEPTGNLDSKIAGQIMTILQNLDKKGITIILVTHELDTAQHAKRIIYLKDGLIESDKMVENRTFTKEGEAINK